MKTGTAPLYSYFIPIELGLAAVLILGLSSWSNVFAAEPSVAPGEITTDTNAATTTSSVNTNALSTPASVSASTNAAAATPPAVDPTQPMRQMLESLQRDITTQVARHTEAITSTLMQIEPALNRIRQQQEQAVASSNRTILIAAGLFAVAGFFGLGFLTMASVRAMGRFTEVAVNANANASPRRQLPGGGEGTSAAAPATSSDGFKPVVSGTVEQASARFQGAIEQLERRIVELEHTSHPAVGALGARTAEANAGAGAGGTSKGTSPTNAGGSDGNGTPHALSSGATTSASAHDSSLGATASATTPSDIPDLNASTASSQPSRIELELGKGQALLNLDQASQALECFENALTEQPNNTDALLRKGMALEKLQEWERALECYDRVIGLDDSVTVAHLYRGGVCNRLERHREALESYEKALRSEREQRPANTNPAMEI